MMTCQQLHTGKRNAILRAKYLSDPAICHIALSGFFNRYPKSVIRLFEDPFFPSARRHMHSNIHTMSTL